MQQNSRVYFVVYTIINFLNVFLFCMGYIIYNYWLLTICVSLLHIQMQINVI